MVNTSLLICNSCSSWASYKNNQFSQVLNVCQIAPAPKAQMQGAAEEMEQLKMITQFRLVCWLFSCSPSSIKCEYSRPQRHSKSHQTMRMLWYSSSAALYASACPYLTYRRSTNLFLSELRCNWHQILALEESDRHTALVKATHMCSLCMQWSTANWRHWFDWIYETLMTLRGWMKLRRMAARNLCLRSLSALRSSIHCSSHQLIRLKKVLPVFLTAKSARYSLRCKWQAVVDSLTHWSVRP